MVPELQPFSHVHTKCKQLDTGVLLPKKKKGKEKANYTFDKQKKKYRVFVYVGVSGGCI